MNESERQRIIERMDSEPPIVVRPSIAKEIGLNEAIVLQQLMYWLNRSGKTRDGKTWVYKTYDEWTSEFPFWSNATVRRTIKSLRDMGLVETTDEYNKMKIDNTLWYTIPGYGVSRPSAQNEQTHLLKMSKPITREYTKTTINDELTAAITEQLQTHMPFGVTPQLVEQHRAIATQYGLDAWKAGFEATPQRAKHNANYVLKATLSNLPEVEPVKKAAPATITIYGDDGKVLEVVET